MIKKYIMIGISLLSISLAACSNSQSEKNSVLMEQELIKDDNQQNNVITTTIENIDAVYIGQKDKNTVEIIVDGKSNTYLLEELKDADIKSFTKDAKVKISYMIKTEQVKDGEIKMSYLTKIKKA